MRRHRTELVPLFFGLAFLAAGVGFIVHQTTGRAFDATWIVAIGLVSIGCIFLGATLLRGPRPAPEAAPAPEPEPPVAVGVPVSDPGVAIETERAERAEPEAGDQ
jgi:hypothetical protein